MGTHVLSTLGEGTVTTRLEGFWSGGDQPWIRNEEAEDPEDPLERREKAPPLVKEWLDPPKFHRCTLSPGRTHLKAYPTEVFGQGFKAVFETIHQSTEDIGRPRDT